MAFVCIECGHSESKWLGRCPRCDEWDTFQEESVTESPGVIAKEVLRGKAEKLSEIDCSLYERIISGWSGFDRLIGNGVVKGEVILFGGPPGVGKSTIFLQLAERYSQNGKKVLFVSGEENPGQLKIHADRLNVRGVNITVLGSGDLAEVYKAMEELNPDMVFVDSIQAVADPDYSGMPGSLMQVKKSGLKLTTIAKNTGATVFISGQITKQGDIAGPKVLEHMVDAVVYMDYLETSSRIISITKNRFGSCGDFILYSLNDDGLEELDDINRSKIMSGNRKVPGQITSCTRVGSRLVVVELQTLVTGSYFEYPLRRTSGFSRERLLMINAIVEKHLGLKLGSLDVYLNVSGGNKVTERVSDLGVAGSIYSSMNNIPVSNKVMFLGEMGLNGEIRPQQDVMERIKFAKRNNFEKVVLSGYGKKIEEKEIKLEYIKNINELKGIIAL